MLLWSMLWLSIWIGIDIWFFLQGNLRYYQYLFGIWSLFTICFMGDMDIDTKVYANKDCW